MKKPRILVVGSFMMDLVASARRAPNLGETVIGFAFRTAPGGKGANQAVQAARLGAITDMVGCVGNDSFGREMIGELFGASLAEGSRLRINLEQHLESGKAVLFPGTGDPAADAGHFTVMRY